MTEQTDLPTREEIAESQRICDAATPGPWFAYRVKSGWWTTQFASGWLFITDWRVPEGRVANVQPDHAFTAHAREALPARNRQLLAAMDEIERLRAMLKRWVSRPEYMPGWPGIVANFINTRMLDDACEVWGVPVPEHCRNPTYAG